MKKKITTAKYLLLDASTWKMLFDHQDEFSIHEFYSVGIVPFLTSEVFFEFLNVSPDSQERRHSFLRNVPILATLSLGSEVLGDHIDLRCLEYQRILENQSSSSEDFVLGKVSLTSGAALAQYLLLGPLGLSSERKLVDLSISQSIWKLFPDTHIRNEKLKDLRFHETIDADAAEGSLNQIRGLLVENSQKKKVTQEERERAAAIFVQYMEPIAAAQNDIRSLLATVSERIGMSLDKIDPEMTLDQFFSLVEYRVKLSVISARTGYGFERLSSIPEEEISSWMLEKTFKKVYEEKLLQDDRRPPEASTITDKQLATFSNYMAVIVDKRTRDILDEVSALLKKTLKFSFMADLDQLRQYLKDI